LREVVRAHPQVRFVQGTAAGTGEVVRRAGLTADDLERVQVASSVGVHASQLAEWAIFGLLAFAKGLPRLLADQAAHRWGPYPVRELDGEHLVIVGLGQIGRQTARYARALGMRVTGVRRQHGNAPDPDVDELRSVDELGDIFPTCDAVVLALPNTAETAGLVTRDLLAALPTHAIVVNVGRGRTVDEEGLVDALRAGRLGGAALDVFATEPLPADSPLWDLPNVLISPHTAALSVRENERIVELFVENLQRYRRGESVRNRIDPRHFY
jgi:phosphoglycerate dehydrogenase-like enzyme